MTDYSVKRKIRSILTAAEKDRIVDQAVIANPLMLGARYDDVLERAWDTDAYVSAYEPFFDANKGWLEIDGAAYAAMVICAQGRPLTPLNLTEMMTRAGLMRESREDFSDRYHPDDVVEFASDDPTVTSRQGRVVRVLMFQSRNPVLVLQAADMPDGITIMRQASAVQFPTPGEA